MHGTNNITFSTQHDNIHPKTKHFHVEEETLKTLTVNLIGFLHV
jgi:hypothetical protein